MGTAFVAAATAFAIALVLTPVVRRFAHRVGYLDVPSDKSSHSIPTPRSGGYVMLLGILVAAWVTDGYGNRDVLVMAAGTLILAGLAAADEMRELSRMGRFLAQIAVTAATVYGSHALIQGMALPLGAIASQSLSGLLSVVWIVGLINGYNFMDGLNGLASVQGIVCGTTLAAFFLRTADHSGAVMAAGMAGACAGFLPWNMPRGSIFMGDVGSSTLGFLFALLVVRLSTEGVPIVAASLPLLPFLLDAGVTLVRRAVAGERFFSTGHRSHFYQRLNRTGWSHANVTLLYGALAAISAALALTYPSLTEPARVLSVTGALGVHVVVALWITSRESRPRVG